MPRSKPSTCRSTLRKGGKSPIRGLSMPATISNHSRRPAQKASNLQVRRELWLAHQDVAVPSALIVVFGAAHADVASRCEARERNDERRVEQQVIAQGQRAVAERHARELPHAAGRSSCLPGSRTRRDGRAAALPRFRQASCPSQASARSGSRARHTPRTSACGQTNVAGGLTFGGAARGLDAVELRGHVEVRPANDLSGSLCKTLQQAAPLARVLKHASRKHTMPPQLGVPATGRRALLQPTKDLDFWLRVDTLCSAQPIPTRTMICACLSGATATWPADHRASRWASGRAAAALARRPVAHSSCTSTRLAARCNAEQS